MAHPEGVGEHTGPEPEDVRLAQAVMVAGRGRQHGPPENIEADHDARHRAMTLPHSLGVNASWIVLRRRAGLPTTVVAMRPSSTRLSIAVDRPRLGVLPICELTATASWTETGLICKRGSGTPYADAMTDHSGNGRVRSRRAGTGRDSSSRGTCHYCTSPCSPDPVRTLRALHGT